MIQRENGKEKEEVKERDNKRKGNGTSKEKVLVLGSLGFGERSLHIMSQKRKSSGQN